MLNIVTFFSVIVLLLSKVTAGVLQDRSTFLHALVSRQLPAVPSIPTQCSGQCQALNTLEACSDLNCMCTSAIDQGLKTCLQCITSLGPTGSAASDAQQALSGFEQACAQAGIPIGSTPGPTSAAGIPTSGPVGTGAAPGASSTTGLGAATSAAPATGLPSATGTGTATPTTASSGVNPFGKTGAAAALRSSNVGVLGIAVMLVLGVGCVMA